MTSTTKTKTRDLPDPRTETIGSIWGIAVGALAICIPLCAILKSAIIPVIVVGGAVFVSVYVWKSDADKSSAANKENERLRAQIRDLEERLANVEVLNSFEERLAERTIARQEQEASGTRELEPPV